MALYPIFDLDGTLLDSDVALVDAFVRLGISADRITFGHVIGEECRRLGLSLDDFVAAYDPVKARPFPEVAELLDSLDGYGICSNKDGRIGRLELKQWGWSPAVALFTEDFGGGPKSLVPVLDALGLAAGDVVFVGDTDHDRRSADAVGCRFILAGWNPRAAAVSADDTCASPADVAGLLG